MYERILVPLDGSQIAEVALDYAAELARLAKAEIVLLRVTATAEAALNAPTADLTGEAGWPAFGQYVERHRSEELTAKEYLQNHCGALGDERIVARAVTAQGDAADEILATAKNVGASIIVMTTHGHGARHHVEVGSVTEAVLRNSTVPVLAIPHRIT